MKNMTKTNMDEAKLAAEIVSVLQPAALRACSAERDVIRYAVRGDSLKLRTIIFDRSALGRLLKTRDGNVKIEYLKRSHPARPGHSPRDCSGRPAPHR
jgi:hypothetical protein